MPAGRRRRWPRVDPHWVLIGLAAMIAVGWIVAALLRDHPDGALLGFSGSLVMAWVMLERDERDRQRRQRRRPQRRREE